MSAPIRPFCPPNSAILSLLFGQNGRLFYIRNLIRVHCTPDSRWCHHYARACTRVHTREKTALKDAGWRARLAPFRYAAARIGAPRGCFLQGFDAFPEKIIARCGGVISLGEWQKGRFSGVVRLTAILCGVFFAGKGEHMYTRPLFTRRPVANYREIIKSRLKHWRKLANMSQAQAAKLAGVARSTWQTWEDPARGALPDLAALAAVADGCRIEPGAALEWLVTEHRAQETAPAAAPMIGGGLKIEVNGF